MKVTTHHRLVRRRRRQALGASLFGFLILAAGLLISLQGPQAILIAYGALLVGSAFSWIGLWLSDTWLRMPRPDAALDEALKSASRGYALYHWVLPADHVLLAPWGLVVFSVHSAAGPVTIKGSHWRELRPLWQRLLTFGRRPLRSPREWLQLDAHRLAEAIQLRAPELASVPVLQLAVFSQLRASLSVEDPDVPVVRADELRSWLREQRLPALKPAERRRLETVLDELASARLRPGSTPTASPRGASGN